MGRLHILDKLVETINQPNDNVKAHAPKIIKLTIPNEFIGAVIGPGGKVIQEMQKETDTTIVIEEPNKFGLAQLHQLRGRVGRNNLISNCILFHNDKMSENAKKRLEIMRMSNDGFFIAEKDLEIRGGGDMFGTKQTGLPSWRFFNPYNDIELIEEVKENLVSLMDKKQRVRDLISIFFNESKFDYFFSG